MTDQLRKEQEKLKSSQDLFSNNTGSPNTFSQGIVGSRSQNRIYVHSNPNGMNFNGFNGGHMADEQLL